MFCTGRLLHHKICLSLIEHTIGRDMIVWKCKERGRNCEWGRSCFCSEQKFVDGDRESSGKIIITVVFFFIFYNHVFWIMAGLYLPYLEKTGERVFILFSHFSFAFVLFGGWSHFSFWWQKCKSQQELSLNMTYLRRSVVWWYWFCILERFLLALIHFKLGIW